MCYAPPQVCGMHYYFAENRFRFLVEWDPNALFRPNAYGYMPIHLSSIKGLIHINI
jgi:hypothetical protein